MYIYIYNYIHIYIFIYILIYIFAEIGSWLSCEAEIWSTSLQDWASPAGRMPYKNATDDREDKDTLLTPFICGSIKCALMFLLQRRNCVRAIGQNISDPTTLSIWNRNVSNVQIRHFQICRLEKIRGRAGKTANWQIISISNWPPPHEGQRRDEAKTEMTATTIFAITELCPNLTMWI